MNGARSRLFCWSAGGFPGLDVHAGVWLALNEQHIFPTACAGTSAGAVMAAMVAGGSLPETCVATLRRLKDADVRDERALWKLRAMHITSFLRHEPVVRLLDALVPPRFEDCRMPLSVFATNENLHRADEFKEGDLRQAVLASLSIPGVFPPVAIRGSDYSDGATHSYVPLPADCERYDEVWLIVARPPIRYTQDDSIVSRLMRSIHEMIEDQITDTIEAARGLCRRVQVVRPPCGASAPSLRFHHALIADAYQWTTDHMQQILEGRT
jgi:NTE family protein